VAGLRRNQWLEWIGITGCFAPDTADVLVNREQGIKWLVENHGGITPYTVRAVFDFYDRHKTARVRHLA
jgi:hypothetical protein